MHRVRLLQPSSSGAARSNIKHGSSVLYTFSALFDTKRSPSFSGSSCISDTFRGATAAYVSNYSTHCFSCVARSFITRQAAQAGGVNYLWFEVDDFFRQEQFITSASKQNQILILFVCLYLMTMPGIERNHASSFFLTASR